MPDPRPDLTWAEDAALLLKLWLEENKITRPQLANMMKVSLREVERVIEKILPTTNRETEIYARIYAATAEDHFDPCKLPEYFIHTGRGNQSDLYFKPRWEQDRWDKWFIANHKQVTVHHEVREKNYHLIGAHAVSEDEIQQSADLSEILDDSLVTQEPQVIDAMEASEISFGSNPVQETTEKDATEISRKWDEYATEAGIRLSRDLRRWLPENGYHTRMSFARTLGIKRSLWDKIMGGAEVLNNEFAYLKIYRATGIESADPTKLPSKKPLTSEEVDEWIQENEETTNSGNSQETQVNSETNQNIPWEKRLAKALHNWSQKHKIKYKTQLLSMFGIPKPLHKRYINGDFVSKYHADYAKIYLFTGLTEADATGIPIWMRIVPKTLEYNPVHRAASQEEWDKWIQELKDSAPFKNRSQAIRWLQTATRFDEVPKQFICNKYIYKYQKQGEITATSSKKPSTRRSRRSSVDEPVPTIHEDVTYSDIPDEEGLLIATAGMTDSFPSEIEEDVPLPEESDFDEQLGEDVSEIEENHYTPDPPKQGSNNTEVFMDHLKGLFVSGFGIVADRIANNLASNETFQEGVARSAVTQIAELLKPLFEKPSDMPDIQDLLAKRNSDIVSGDKKSSAQIIADFDRLLQTQFIQTSRETRNRNLNKLVSQLGPITAALDTLAEPNEDERERNLEYFRQANRR